jgi:hypothetical protein
MLGEIEMLERLIGRTCERGLGVCVQVIGLNADV